MSTLLACEQWQLNIDGTYQCITGTIFIDVNTTSINTVVYDEAFYLELTESLTLGFFLYLSGWVLMKPIELAINFMRDS